MLTFSKIFFPLSFFSLWKKSFFLNTNLETKFWIFALASRRNSPKARAAGMFFSFSKDKNACVDLSSQTGPHPRAEAGSSEVQNTL